MKDSIDQSKTRPKIFRIYSEDFFASRRAEVKLDRSRDTTTVLALEDVQQT